MTIAMMLAISTIIRTDIFILYSVSREYNLDREQTILLLAIYKSENGVPGRELGILNKQAQRYRGNRFLSLQCQSRWCAGTIKKHYTGNLRAFANRYCPIGVQNDPSGLNQNWYNNVSYWMEKIEKKEN